MVPNRRGVNGIVPFKLPRRIADAQIRYEMHEPFIIQA
jgi:hypothetical protein